ncbi:hypothetical protein [Methanospirillum lacunae]|uniref:Uncharacterized protein n=1 Tax=Methanospirillum lacunae TaxID=668570 RepID=A0A2V2MXS4_9EURY|nr:hypothetical protein [Methanospirillum lacunae]PWR72722.1 hypothetical protein DK846_07160 [Methanospirillum lacunae]
MRDNVRILLYGFLTWLIPFLLSIPFYSGGGLQIDQQLFKSIMIVAGALTGAALIIHLFSVMTMEYQTAGYVTGVAWLLINWGLDIVILIPLSGLDFISYTFQIGLRYLVIPVMTIMAGVVAEHAARKESQV